MDEPNARLAAFLRTGADGRYAFATVRPAPDPVPMGFENDETRHIDPPRENGARHHFPT